MVFNGASTLRSTLESLAVEKTKDVEYVVIDGGSTDGTLDILNNYSNIIDVLISEPDRGIYDAMNKGVSNSSGEIIGFLNADDLLNTGGLVGILEYFKNARVDYICTDVNVINFDGTVAGEMLVDRKALVGSIEAFGRRDWRFSTPFPHMGLYVRRSSIDRKFMFDIKYKISADHEFMSWLISKEKHGVYADFKIASFRLGGASGSAIAVLKEDSKIAEIYGMSMLHTMFLFARTLIGRFRSKKLGRGF